MNAQMIQLLMLAIAGVLFLLVIAAFFIRRTVIATIAGFFWERKVLLEHYVWQQETSHTGYPDGSRNRQRTTESYQSYELIRYETRTTTTNGNTSTTTEPVYGYVPRSRTKYIYEIQRWIDSRELMAKGEERVTLHWPAYILDRSTKEREKRKWEKYQVFFQTAKGKRYKQDLPKTDWTALDDKATYILKVNIFGQVMHFAPDAKQLAAMPMQTP